MGKVIASCGCELTKEEGFGYDARIKDYTGRDGRTVLHSRLCKKCFAEYEKAGLLLKEDEWIDWLNDSTEQSRKEN